MKKTPKIPKARLLAAVRKAATEGSIFYSVHALERLEERGIITLEVRYVLKTGRHEHVKDEYKVEHNAWNYAIRGKTLDGRDLRIAVAIDSEGVLVVTAIDLDRSKMN